MDSLVLEVKWDWVVDSLLFGSSDIAVRSDFWCANSSYHTPPYITAYAPGNLNNGHHGFRLVKTISAAADDGYAAW